MRETPILLGVALWCLGCDPIGPEEVECSDEVPSVVVTAVSPGADGTSLVLNGTAEHPDRLTIRNIHVQGLAVTKQSTNFATWTVTLPQGVWQPLEQEESVNLTVVVADPCDEWPAAELVKLPDELTDADSENGASGAPSGP